MVSEQKKAPEKEGASTLSKEKKGGEKAPLFEGIRIGISGRTQGPNGACMEVRGGKELPSVIFSDDHLEVGTRSIGIIGEGAKTNERGQKSASIFVFDPESEKGDAWLDLLPVEEGSFLIGETETRIKLTMPLGRDVGPDEDTDPLYVIPQKLLPGGEEVWDGIMFRTLMRGESITLEGGYLLKHPEEAPGGNAQMEILDAKGERVAKLDGVEGDSFEIKLGGVERRLILKIVEIREATGAIDVLIFPKKEEKKIETEGEGKE